MQNPGQFSAQNNRLGSAFLRSTMAANAPSKLDHVSLLY